MSFVLWRSPEKLAAGATLAWDAVFWRGATYNGPTQSGWCNLFHTFCKDMNISYWNSLFKDENLSKTSFFSLECSAEAMKVDGDFVGFAFAGQNVSSGSSSRNKNPELSRGYFRIKWMKWCVFGQTWHAFVHLAFVIEYKTIFLRSTVSQSINQSINLWITFTHREPLEGQ